MAINYASIQRRALLETTINVGMLMIEEKYRLIGLQNMACEHLIREIVQVMHGERRFPSG